jgi:toxin ParE1/3/4
MSGYAFHPDAVTDLEELWEYIAERNLDAADRVIADIFDALRTLVASPHIGRRRPDLNFALLALQAGSGLFDRLRTRRTSAVGRPRASRQA